MECFDAECTKAQEDELLNFQHDYCCQCTFFHQSSHFSLQTDTHSSFLLTDGHVYPETYTFHATSNTAFLATYTAPSVTVQSAGFRTASIMSGVCLILFGAAASLL
jgi:hypothetical protein